MLRGYVRYKVRSLRRDAMRLSQGIRVEIKTFRKIVWEYYATHPRVMPWREKITPYRVFVSEVMLQQTQVARVREKFPAFIRAFPSFKALAKAPLQSVLAAWQGMGYNRRALYLKTTAETVVREYAGHLPKTTEDIERLSGIGSATARSIAAFAWNSPEVFIETNIRAVFLHHFFPNAFGISDKQLMPFVERAQDKENPREWQYALMDYGTMLKKEYKNPSRASAHHVKQSKFKGSMRETRGKIVKLLAGYGPLTDVALARRSVEPPTKVRAALYGLVRDGLVRQKGAKFGIS